MIRKAPPRLLAAPIPLLFSILLHPIAPASPAPEVLGVVDGIPITQADWDHLAKPYFGEIEARAGRKLTEEEEALLRKNVLDELVRERLWVADAKRRGFTATEAEIDVRLSKNPYFRTGGKFDQAKFRDFKLSAASNYRRIQGQIENAVLLDKYVKWMQTRYAPREAELRREFAERTAQASLRYFWLTPDAVSLETQAADDRIRAYYDAHPEEFKTPEEARISHIRIPIEAVDPGADSLRSAAEAAAYLVAKAAIASLKAGKPADAVAKDLGGVKDTGFFRVGDPIKGLGRSDALADAIRAAQPKQWLPEPVRIGPYYVVARLEARHDPRVRSFREVVGLAKRRADALLRDAEMDSIARADYGSRPERYRVPLLRGSVIARATASFDDPRPIPERDLTRTLARLRKSAGMPDTARAWADSVLKSLPDLVRTERRLGAAFKTMGEVASRLRRGEREEEVAQRVGATLDRVSIYQGQPPAAPSLVEGSLLDSLYQKRAGAVVGPLVLRDSVFVVRVAEVDDRFLPPFEAVRVSARSEAELERRRGTEREAEAYFATRRDQYVTPQRWAFDFVPFRKMTPDSAPVPEDSIQAYYDARPLEFTVPAKAHARHILITFRPGDGPGAREAARKTALRILKRVQAGEDFASLARELSEDRGSAAKGGDLGEITRGEVVKEFGDAAFALKPGEISDLVESRFGFHIIKLEGMTPQRLRSLKDCRAEIRGVLGGALVDSLARREAADFAAAASKEGASFEEVARTRGGMKSAPPVGAREPVPGIGAIAGIETDIGSLPEGGVSGPIACGGGYIVARLERSIPPRQASFGEVKDNVIRDMQGERRRALADSIDARLKEALHSGADLESLLVPLGGLRVSRFFGRRGPIPDLARDSLLARDSALFNEIFASRPGTVLRPRPGSLGALFAVVDSLKTPTDAEYRDRRSELRREMIEQRSAAWTERLRSRAKIELYRGELKLEP